MVVIQPSPRIFLKKSRTRMASNKTRDWEEHRLPVRKSHKRTKKKDICIESQDYYSGFGQQLERTLEGDRP
jgi:hypothetical protein